MTTPMDLLPDAPTRSDPDNFSSKGDALMTALPKLVQQFNQRLPTVDAAVQAGADSAISAASAAASAASALAAPGTNATSTTALAVGSGVLSLVIQPNKDIVVGAVLMCARTADPDNVWMLGQARSYTKATGALVLVVATGDTKGSGTFSDWTLSLSSVRSSVLSPVDGTQVGPTIRPSFMNDIANSKRLDQRFAYTMASALTYFDAAGVMREAIAGVPAIDHDPLTGRCLGLWMSEFRTNSIRNNTMAGAVAGSPGTLPTNWIGTSAAGVTQTIVGTGTEKGIDYIDIRFQLTGANNAFITFDSNTTINAAPGQTWTASQYVAVVGGSLANLTLSKHITEWTSAGVFLTETATPFTPSGPLNTSRPILTRTLTNASAARITSAIGFLPSGAADITLRIGLPQLEQGAYATPAMKTANGAITRNGATLAMPTSAFEFNAQEGTLVVSYTKGATVPVGCLAALQKAGAALTDFIELRDGSALAGTPGSADLFVFAGSVTQADTAGPWSVDNTPHIAAAAYKTNDFAFAFDGGGLATDSSGTVPTGIDQLAIGACGPTMASDRFAGWVSKVAYYPKRLSNSELLALSTL